MKRSGSFSQLLYLIEFKCLLSACAAADAHRSDRGQEDRSHGAMRRLREREHSTFARNPANVNLPPSSSSEPQLFLAELIASFPGPDSCEPQTFSYLLSDYDLHPHSSDYKCVVAETYALVETCLAMVYFFNAQMAHEFFSCHAKVKEKYTAGPPPDQWDDATKRSRYGHCGVDGFTEAYFFGGPAEQSLRGQRGVPPKFSELVERVGGKGCVKRMHVDLDLSVGTWTSDVARIRLEQLGWANALGLTDAADQLREDESGQNSSGTKNSEKRTFAERVGVKLQSVPLHPTHGSKMWMMSFSYAWMVLIELYHLGRHRAVNPNFDLHEHFTFERGGTEFFKRKFAVCELVRKVAREKRKDFEEDVVEGDELAVRVGEDEARPGAAQDAANVYQMAKKRTTRGSVPNHGHPQKSQHQEKGAELMSQPLKKTRRGNKSPSRRPLIRVAEVGVFHGETVLHLLEHCPPIRDGEVSLQYHLIDPWQDGEREFESMKAFVENENPEYTERIARLEVETETVESPLLDVIPEFAEKWIASANRGPEERLVRKKDATATSRDAGLSPYEVAGADRRLIVGSLSIVESGKTNAQQGSEPNRTMKTFDKTGVFEWKNVERNRKITGDVVLRELVRKLAAAGGGRRRRLQLLNADFVARLDEDGAFVANPNPYPTDTDLARGDDDAQAVYLVEHDADYNYAEDLHLHLSGVFIHRESSTAAARRIPAVDLTFIDGDHSFTGILEDLEAWAPRTQYVLSGHDFAASRFPAIPVALSYFLVASESKSIDDQIPQPEATRKPLTQSGSKKRRSFTSRAEKILSLLFTWTRTTCGGSNARKIMTHHFVFLSAFPSDAGIFSSRSPCRLLILFVCPPSL